MMLMMMMGPSCPLAVCPVVWCGTFEMKTITALLLPLSPPLCTYYCDLKYCIVLLVYI
eukprot:COSAG06_NODE_388_length_16429_cov_129.962094_8_plen_58_part_00